MQVSTFANAVWAPLLGPDTDVDNIEWGDGTHEPHGVAVDGEGNIIFADAESHRICKISPDGNVSTLAGSGSADWGDGQGTQAHFYCPYGVAVDGNDNIIVADFGNHRIRKISPDGNVSTLAGSGSADWGDGQGTQAHFNDPYGVAVDG